MHSRYCTTEAGIRNLNTPRSRTYRLHNLVVQLRSHRWFFCRHRAFTTILTLHGYLWYKCKDAHGHLCQLGGIATRCKAWWLDLRYVSPSCIKVLAKHRIAYLAVPCMLVERKNFLRTMSLNLYMHNAFKICSFEPRCDWKCSAIHLQLNLHLNKSSGTQVTALFLLPIKYDHIECG